MNCLIVTGGHVDFDLLAKASKNANYIIASDHGLEALNSLNIRPNCIIGDFDSVNHNILLNYSDVETIKLNTEKDFTDTHMALKKAIELKYNNIVIIGATGTRIDHLLGNIHILKEALDNNLFCKIIDTNNEIFLINKTTVIPYDLNYKYISLIPFTSSVTGVTLKGFKYSLNNANLEIGYSIGISNEQINDGIIELNNGILIVIKSKD